MSRARSTRARENEEGAAAVEFGLIAPILILLVFGIMSFGILFAQTLSLNNAARQGARYGAVGSRTCDQLIAETKAASGTINLNPSSVTVEVLRGSSLSTAVSNWPTSNCSTGTNLPCIGSSPGENIYVKASYKSKMLIPLYFTPNTFTVGGTGGFRCEYSS